MADTMSTERVLPVDYRPEGNRRARCGVYES